MKESVDTYWHTSTDFHLLSSIVMNSDLLVNGLIQLSALHFLLIIAKHVIWEIMVGITVLILPLTTYSSL